MKFTGERMIPGRSPRRIEADHIERYRFAAAFVDGKTVLDVACGTGYGAQLLVDGGATHVTGIAIAHDAVEYARRHHAALEVRFEVGDLCDLRIGGAYDVITCFETIEHVADLDRALRELAQHLVPGGYLFISSPNRLITSPGAAADSGCCGRFHAREFVPNELADCLVKHGFIVGPWALFGQRFQSYYSWRWLRRVFAAVVNPRETSSPTVAPVRDAVPRYFMIVCTAPPGPRDERIREPRVG